MSEVVESYRKKVADLEKEVSELRQRCESYEKFVDAQDIARQKDWSSSHTVICPDCQMELHLHCYRLYGPEHRVQPK